MRGQCEEMQGRWFNAGIETGVIAYGSGLTNDVAFTQQLCYNARVSRTPPHAGRSGPTENGVKNEMVNLVFHAN